MRTTLIQLFISILLVFQIHECFSQELPCKSYYPKERSGRCQERYLEDSNGEKHGKYIRYDEDGQVNLRGNYDHGIQNGNWLRSDRLPNIYAWYVNGEIMVTSATPFNSYADALARAKAITDAEKKSKAEQDKKIKTEQELARVENEKAEALKKAETDKLKPIAGKINPQLFSISFKPDSYEPDENGSIAIKKFIDEMEKMEALQSGIKFLLIIGHAAADKELNKIQFDPTHEDYLTDKSGRRTSYREDQLEFLRFILTTGRVKSVWRSIENLKLTKDLVDRNALWLVPVGTSCGKELVKNGRSQNIVQIGIITIEDREISSESESTKLGVDLDHSPIVASFDSDCRLLKLNGNKFAGKLLHPTTFGVPVPDYIRLATDMNSLMSYSNEFR